MPPLWVQLWSFHSSRIYCLTCGNFLKKKKEGRKKRYKGKERRNTTRKKEREDEDVKRKKNKELLKKKKPPVGFKLAKAVLLVFLAAADSGGLV